MELMNNATRIKQDQKRYQEEIMALRKENKQPKKKNMRD